MLERESIIGVAGDLEIIGTLIDSYICDWNFWEFEPIF